MNTLFDKIWDKHVVQQVTDGPTQLYIDRLYCHEVTSPQAFDGMRARGLKCFRPEKIFCMPDHNTPTHDQDKPIADPVSKAQVDALARNAAEFGLTHYGMWSKDNGIIHVVGPEKGLSLPGMTIVCGDSHTSTHGAMGAVAFGIGTSEVEMVMASQCILQQKPKSMRISINGQLKKGVTAKDVALYLMAKLTTSGATGYFVEYAGDVVRSLSMEGRLTLCNLSIEMGARGGFIAPDETTFAYLKGREYAPKGEAWDEAVAYWKTLKSGDDAVFDKELVFSADDIEPRVTYGTNPGMGIGITESIPASAEGKLYIDLSFFTQMKRQLGVEGNTFAYAYVIAHEIGHHVENLTGSLGKAHQAMNQSDKVGANQISVRLELLADYYAGVWAHYEEEMNHSMEYGDLEKGLELAKAIGDDWLQKKAQGRATPESFTHGTSDQRKRWLKRGFETGDMRTSTFSIQNYNDL